MIRKEQELREAKADKRYTYIAKRNRFYCGIYMAGFTSEFLMNTGNKYINDIDRNANYLAAAISGLTSIMLFLPTDKPDYYFYKKSRTTRVLLGGTSLIMGASLRDRTLNDPEYNTKYTESGKQYLSTAASLYGIAGALIIFDGLFKKVEPMNISLIPVLSPEKITIVVTKVF